MNKVCGCDATKIQACITYGGNGNVPSDHALDHGGVKHKPGDKSTCDGCHI